MNLVNQRTLVQICVREQKGKLLVRLGRKPSPREIDPGDQKQREELFDSIVDAVKRFYSGEDQSDGSEIKRVGFN